jgi:small subunit ribosomal protein S6
VNGINQKEYLLSYYELLVIFSTNLPDEEEKAQASQIEELIKHEKGTIHLVEHWGKRKLAYPIKKQRQGYYEWFYMELDPSRTAEIDRKLKMSETILRFLIFKMEKIQIQNLQREITRRQDAATAAQHQAETAAAASQAEPPTVAPSAEPAGAAEVEEPVTMITEAPATEAETELTETPTETVKQEPGQEG